MYGALAKAQADIEVAAHNSSNPYFKSRYSDLNAVVKASRPALTKNGLAVIQRVMANGDGRMYLYTRLCHTSGQWIESKMPLNPPRQDIQTLGSYITYSKRYMYAAVCGVVAAEEDDDGENAMNRHETVYGKKQSVPQQESTISPEQLGEIVEALGKDKEKTKELLDHYKLNKLSDLPSKHFDKLIDRLKTIKKD